jgi:hypothetical protein
VQQTLVFFFFFYIYKKILMASDIFKSVCSSIGLAFHISLEHSVLRYEFNKSMKGANLLICLVIYKMPFQCIKSSLGGVVESI